jgi:hypothetical protein
MQISKFQDIPVCDGQDAVKQNRQHVEDKIHEYISFEYYITTNNIKKCAQCPLCVSFRPTRAGTRSTGAMCRFVVATLTISVIMPIKIYKERHLKYIAGRHKEYSIVTIFEVPTELDDDSCARGVLLLEAWRGRAGIALNLDIILQLFSPLFRL